MRANKGKLSPKVMGTRTIPTNMMKHPKNWLLAKRVKTLINCYKCGTEFHNINITNSLKPFLHHIGLKYDKFR